MQHERAERRCSQQTVFTAASARCGERMFREPEKRVYETLYVESCQKRLHYTRETMYRGSLCIHPMYRGL
jgi:hypothetical protein